MHFKPKIPGETVSGAFATKLITGTFFPPVSNQFCPNTGVISIQRAAYIMSEINQVLSWTTSQESLTSVLRGKKTMHGAALAVTEGTIYQDLVQLFLLHTFH